ncbi:MAG: YegS/Rv2252/BmrU family lipid kinase [Eubacteriales bacterium]
MEQSTRKKLLFIYNPHAGKASIKRKLADIIDVFVKEEYEVTVYPTQGPNQATELACTQSDSYDVLVCSGGDGTLDEVVTGMMQAEHKIPIGYIPAGSTNDFARSLHIPRDMMSAARMIVTGTTFPCDIGAFNADTFVYIAAFGIFTDVSYETTQEMKSVLGYAAYVLEGMKRLSSIDAYRLKVTTPTEKIEDEFIFGMVTNSHSVGGFKKITGKSVALDDGLFELILVKYPANPVELNGTLAAILTGSIDPDYMYCVKIEEVLIESEEYVAWTLDGEYGGDHKKVHIRNCKQALEMIVPQRTLRKDRNHK